MDENNVTFDPSFLKLLGDMATVNLFASFMPEKDAKMFKAIIRAFAKHGVSASIVLAAIKDLVVDDDFTELCGEGNG
jgi:hypothetical protein